MISNNRQYRKDRSKCMGKNIDAQVFVESDADTIFWKAVFAHFAPNLKLRFYPSGGETSERGCDRLEEILTNEGVNQYKILCFDSNYSRYWTGNTRYDLPYVLQTYTYAFDNYNTLPQRLNEIVESVTQETDSTKINFDFHDFLAAYSKIIFPLFVCFVAKRRINADCAKPVFSNQAIFQKPLSDFPTIMITINELVQKQIENDYTTISKSEYHETVKELNDIYGINETNTWLYIRGHDLQDKVIFNLLDKVTRAIVDRKIAELKTKIPTEPHFDAILKAYQNHLGIKNKDKTETAQEVQVNESRKGKVNTLLNDAFRFAITDSTCFPMQKIGDKVQYIATHHQSIT